MKKKTFKSIESRLIKARLGLFLFGILFVGILGLTLPLYDIDPIKMAQDAPRLGAGTTESISSFQNISVAEPWDLAINDTGYLYMLEPYRIIVLSPEGSCINHWGTAGYAEGQFFNAKGIAINQSGYIYVADTDNHRVQVFNPTGQFLQSWGGPGTADGLFLSPNDLAVNQTGYIYVVDSSNNRIQVFTQTGEFIGKWNKTSGGSGSGDGEFTFPQGIAINSSGYVYIADTGNNRIQIFNQTGQFIAKWNSTDGSAGSGDGEFNLPSKITINGSDAAFVTDTYNNRVQAFSSTGSFILKWGASGSGLGDFDRAYGIATNATTGIVYVADPQNYRIQTFTQTGQFLSKYGSEAPGILNDPKGIAINGTGYLFIADTNNHRVQVFTPKGQIVSMWGANGGDGTYGSGNGAFRKPTGIAINETGYIYITDTENQRVQVFTPTGQFLNKWGSFGVTDGLFSDPSGIAINASGYVYVSDTWNRRVQVFTQTGQFLFSWQKPAGEYTYGLAINSTGHVFLCESQDRVQAFTQTGELLASWGANGGAGGTGTGDREFNQPFGIAVNASDYIYIADMGNHRVQILDPNGNFVMKWGANGGDGMSGEEIGQFEYPAAIATNFAHIYVADSRNQRIQIFGNSLPFVNGLILTPGPAKTTEDLVISFSYADADNDPIVGVPTIRWYQNGVLQSQFNDALSVPACWTNKSHEWNATVELYDGWEYNPAEWTNTIIIGNTAPVVSNVLISPVAPNAGDSLSVTYTYYDDDGDLQGSVEIRWYKDGILQEAYNNLNTLPAGVTRDGEQWHVTVRVSDGETYGNLQTSLTVDFPVQPFDIGLLIALSIAAITVVGLILYLRLKKKRAKSGLIS